jgi:hypothetical protein
LAARSGGSERSEGFSCRWGDCVNVRYERGLTDFLNVLDVQRQQYEIEEVVIVAE